MKTITSVHNESLRQLSRLLSSAKSRRESGRAVLEGVHLLDACLNAGGSPEAVPSSGLGGFGERRRIAAAQYDLVPEPAVLERGIGADRQLRRGRRDLAERRPFHPFSDDTRPPPSVPGVKSCIVCRP